MYKTIDGRRIWHEEIAGSANAYSGTLDMVSPEDGWTVISSTLYRTTDGGSQWVSVSPDTSPAISIL